MQIKTIGSDDEFSEITSRFVSGYPNTIDVGYGWGELVRQCHEKILTFDQSYKIYQIKEKFGGLRFYVKPTSTPLIYKIEELISPFMRKSYLICESCGKNGNLRKSPTGWMKTLCVEHGSDEMGFISASSIYYVSDTN